jgi:hypothetical protein
MQALFGKDKAAAIARREAAAAQRRQLAELTRQQANIDQQAAGQGRKRGRTLLTYLGSEGAAHI